jgi:hypothetical protein
MPREHRVEAALGLEIELELRGNFQPGYPATGPSYASGGEPGEPDCIEDAEVVGVYLERRARDQYGLPAMESYAHDLGFPKEETRQRPKYERVDLLEKLTPGAREEVLRVWGEVLRHEAEERLLEDSE